MNTGELPLSEREFARVKARVYQVAGISLSEAKQTLVVSRLSKIVHRLGLPSFESYLDFLESPKGAGEQQEFINALTTNLTRFYREDHHFEHLRTYVDGLMRGTKRMGPDGRPRLRIWSAGCSTGQEPYTIALDLLAAFPDLRRWDFRILATDIDTAVTAKAATGTYPEADLAGLSPERTRLFEKAGGGNVRIPAAARSLVAFKQLNLIEGKWPMKGPFDAIFCRNVAIYFERQTQNTLFARLGALLSPGGMLYIGHSENLGSASSELRLVGKTTYQSTRKQNPREAA